MNNVYYAGRNVPPAPTSSPKQGSHVIGGYITGETAKAICITIMQIDGVEVDIEPNKHWFPFSQVSSIFRKKSPGGELDTITATEWICRQKELPV